MDYIFNIEEIHNVKITKNNCIFLFDEIDSGTILLKSRKEIQNAESKAQTEDKDIKDLLMLNVLTNLNTDKNSNNYVANNNKLTLGHILSKLDGIGNYSGMIIVATTNHIENLDPALYRELRLTPVNFTYLRKEDAKEIIEKFFNIKLQEELIKRIPDRSITPSKLIFMCEKYENLDINIFFNEYLCV